MSIGDTAEQRTSTLRARLADEVARARKCVPRRLPRGIEEAVNRAVLAAYRIGDQRGPAVLEQQTKRVMPMVDRFLKIEREERGSAELDDISFAISLPILIGLRDAYELGSEHKQVTGDWSELQRRK